ncbi:unnamed protein product, partial [Amoebophrya sp. A120]
HPRCSRNQKDGESAAPPWLAASSSKKPLNAERRKKPTPAGPRAVEKPAFIKKAPKAAALPHSWAFL